MSKIVRHKFQESKNWQTRHGKACSQPKGSEGVEIWNLEQQILSIILERNKRNNSNERGAETYPRKKKKTEIEKEIKRKIKQVWSYPSPSRLRQSKTKQNFSKHCWKCLITNYNLSACK